MKVKLAKWVGNIPNLPSWFIVDKVIDITFDQLIELYNTGNNIMLRHWSCTECTSDCALLFVDNKNFGQR